MSDNAIKVENLGKKFLIGHKVESDLRGSLANKFRSLIRQSNGQAREEFWALKDVSFEIKKGEAVGIIGRNGAGKSTLLKILSRITDPSTGRFEINGRVSSLLEVGTGFHSELTGRENIYLNGTILGMRRSEIKKKFDAIVDFSGVEKFIDTPVKHYSSGMKVRLAFSVAAHLEPEILVIDEVLAVGDAEFQNKCLGKMDEVSKKQGRTILFVSHNLSAINDLCPKSILLHNGRIVNKATSNEIITSYLNSIQKGETYKGIVIRHSFSVSNAWDINTYLNLEISWEKTGIFNEDTCVDVACYTFDSTKIFAVQSDRVGRFDLSKARSITFKIQNAGLPDNTLFFDIGFRYRGSSTYFILNQKCFSIVPSPGNLPPYKRHDVIIIPDIKVEIAE